jgi:predicted esterase
VQSSQPATETAFCWDDRGHVRRDLGTLLPRLPAHGEIVLTGFSQGGQVALELALAGDVVPAEAVIAVGPSFPPGGHFPAAARRLAVVLLHGTDDPWGRGVAATAEALRAAGHGVVIDEVAGLGHAFPADFPERIGGLLAKAGVRGL